MNLCFDVMFEDEVVASICIENNRLIKAETYTDITFKQPFLKKPISIEYVKAFLESRTVDRNKPDIQDILRSLGLGEYNIIEILKKTHGTDFDDFTWVRFKGENLTWKDVKLRQVYELFHRSKI